MAETAVRVLVVDDSATARLSLRQAFSEEPTIEVVGEVARGAEVLGQVRRLRPDLVTMDVYLHTENGLDVAATVMAERAVPILAVTAANHQNPELVYRAMAAGVLEVCAKLPSPQAADYPARRAELIRIVRALARVPVVRRWASARPSSAPSSSATEAREPVRIARQPPLPSDLTQNIVQSAEWVLLGASTGGPQLVCDLLKNLPRLVVPVVVVQHITRGFTDGFAEWLAANVRRPVEVVQAACVAKPNVVYLPGDGHNVELRGGKLLAPVSAPSSAFTPSIDVLFASAARHAGPSAVAVLMTGMGRDGAAGLLDLERIGATTVAQTPSTCVVDSMPRTAIDLGAVRHVLHPKDIGRFIAMRCAAV